MSDTIFKLFLLRQSQKRDIMKQLDLLEQYDPDLSDFQRYKKFLIRVRDQNKVERFEELVNEMSEIKDEWS